MQFQENADVDHDLFWAWRSFQTWLPGESPILYPVVCCMFPIIRLSRSLLCAMSKSGTWYYAVKHGRVPGVYHTWYVWLLIVYLGFNMSYVDLKFAPIVSESFAWSLVVWETLSLKVLISLFYPFFSLWA